MPAAAGAEQGGQAAVGDVDRDVVERDEVAEALGHVLGDDAPLAFTASFGEIGCMAMVRPPWRVRAMTWSRLLVVSAGLRRSRFMENEDEDRQDREQDRRRVGARDVEVVVLVLDEEGERLGLARDLARDDRDRAELAERAGGGEDDAVGDAPADRRQGDLPEGLPAVGARASSAACSWSSPISCSTGITSRTTNGSETKIVASTRPGVEKMIWMPSVVERAADEAVDAVDEEQREPDHDRRDGERQVDQRVDDRLARGTSGGPASARRARRRSC